MRDRPNRLRIPVTDAEVPISPGKALTVQSVPQEYAYLARLECTCGAHGRMEMIRQALLATDAGYMDRLDVSCRACGASYSFFFDVSGLFTQYDRMLKPPEDPDA